VIALAKQRLNTRWRTLLMRQLCVTAHKIAVNVAPARLGGAYSSSRLIPQ